MSATFASQATHVLAATGRAGRRTQLPNHVGVILNNDSHRILNTDEVWSHSQATNTHARGHPQRVETGQRAHVAHLWLAWTTPASHS